MDDSSKTDFSGKFHYSRRGYQNLEAFVPFMILAVFGPFVYILVSTSAESVRTWGNADYWITGSIALISAVYFWLTAIYRRSLSLGEKGYREWVRMGPFTLWSEEYEYAVIDSFVLTMNANPRRRHNSYRIMLRLADGRVLPSFRYRMETEARRIARVLNEAVVANKKTRRRQSPGQISCLNAPSR